MTLSRMSSHASRPLSFLISLFIIFISTTQSAYSEACQPGGYALRTSEESCPAGSKICGGGLVTRCCPSNTTCLITDNAFCCKGNDDCRASLIDTPRCPVADWSVWSMQETIDLENTWCCKPGQFGLVVPMRQNQTGVKCKAYGEPLKQGETTAASISTSPCTDSGSFSTSASSPTSASNPASASNSTVKTSAPSPDDNKFSAGAIAGIVIGAVIGVLACVVGGLILWRKNRKNTAEGPIGAQERVQDATVAQIDGHEVPKYKQSSLAQYGGIGVNQLDGNAVYELGVGQTQIRN